MAKRAKQTSKTHSLPPFPPLQWDEFLWSADIKLKAWSGFQSRRGAYAARDSKLKSKGEVRLSVEPAEGTEDPPTQAQAAAFQHLSECEEQIRDSILKAVFAWYPTMRPTYVESEDDAELMPEISNAQELKKLIGLSTVHIQSISKNGVAYVGYEFGCNWDREHGLGVMMHQDRVVQVGGADTAFLGWIADQDSKSKSRKTKT